MANVSTAVAIVLAAIIIIVGYGYFTANPRVLATTSTTSTSTSTRPTTFPTTSTSTTTIPYLGIVSIAKINANQQHYLGDEVTVNGTYFFENNTPDIPGGQYIVLNNATAFSASFGMSIAYHIPKIYLSNNPTEYLLLNLTPVCQEWNSSMFQSTYSDCISGRTVCINMRCLAIPQNYSFTGVISSCGLFTPVGGSVPVCILAVSRFCGQLGCSS